MLEELSWKGRRSGSVGLGGKRSCERIQCVWNGVFKACQCLSFTINADTSQGHVAMFAATPHKPSPDDARTESYEGSSTVFQVQDTTHCLGLGKNHPNTTAANKGSWCASLRETSLNMIGPHLTATNSQHAPASAHRLLCASTSTHELTSFNISQCHMTSHHCHQYLATSSHISLHCVATLNHPWPLFECCSQCWILGWFLSNPIEWSLAQNSDSCWVNQFFQGTRVEWCSCICPSDGKPGHQFQSASGSFQLQLAQIECICQCCENKIPVTEFGAHSIVTTLWCVGHTTSTNIQMSSLNMSSKRAQSHSKRGDHVQWNGKFIPRNLLHEWVDFGKQSVLVGMSPRCRSVAIHLNPLYLEELLHPWKFQHLLDKASAMAGNHDLQATEEPCSEAAVSSTANGWVDETSMMRMNDQSCLIDDDGEVSLLKK